MKLKADFGDRLRLQGLFSASKYQPSFKMLNAFFKKLKCFLKCFQLSAPGWVQDAHLSKTKFEKFLGFLALNSTQVKLAWG